MGFVLKRLDTKMASVTAKQEDFFNHVLSLADLVVKFIAVFQKIVKGVYASLNSECLIGCRRSSCFSPTLFSGADLSRCGLPPIISFSSFSSVLTDDFAYCFEYCREPDEKFDEGFKPMIEATVAVNAALKFLLFLPGQDYILKPVE